MYYGLYNVLVINLLIFFGFFIIIFFSNITIFFTKNIKLLDVYLITFLMKTKITSYFMYFCIFLYNFLFNKTTSFIFNLFLYFTSLLSLSLIILRTYFLQLIAKNFTLEFLYNPLFQHLSIFF